MVCVMLKEGDRYVVELKDNSRIYFTYAIDMLTFVDNLIREQMIGE